MCPIIVRYIGGSNINFEGLLVISVIQWTRTATSNVLRSCTGMYLTLYSNRNVVNVYTGHKQEPITLPACIHGCAPRLCDSVRVRKAPIIIMHNRVFITRS